MIQLSLIHHLMNHLISAVKPFPLPSPQLLTTRRHLSFHVVQKTLKVSGTQRETLLQRTLDTRGQLSKPPIFRWFCCVFFYSGQSSTWCFCDFQGDDMMIHLRLLLEFGKKNKITWKTMTDFLVPATPQHFAQRRFQPLRYQKQKPWPLSWWMALVPTPLQWPEVLPQVVWKVVLFNTSCLFGEDKLIKKYSCQAHRESLYDFTTSHGFFLGSWTIWGWPKQWNMPHATCNFLTSSWSSTTVLEFVQQTQTKSLPTNCKP